jgi:hypothetical protein
MLHKVPEVSAELGGNIPSVNEEISGVCLGTLSDDDNRMRRAVLVAMLGDLQKQLHVHVVLVGINKILTSRGDACLLCDGFVS